MLDLALQKINRGDVEEGLFHMNRHLFEIRLNANEQEWKALVDSEILTHPLRDVVHREPVTTRSFIKPRGYAGDAIVLDYIYAIPPEDRLTDDLTKRLHACFLNSSGCNSVRNRLGIVASRIDDVAQSVEQPHILSVACGHARELDRLSAVRNGNAAKFVALDQDAVSLAVVKECYDAPNVEILNCSIRQLIARTVELPRFHFVYALGLYDYLSQRMAH